MYHFWFINHMYQGHVKALWLIKRHANDDSHKVKAGWYLDGANEVLVSKPKSEPNHILVAENLHSTRPIFVSSTFMALAVPSKRSFCGFPLLKAYTESTEVNSISSSFLFLAAWRHYLAHLCWVFLCSFLKFKTGSAKISLTTSQQFM